MARIARCAGRRRAGAGGARRRRGALGGVLAMFLLCPPAFAGTPAQLAPAQSARPARPALWRVADADTTIYLFGTIHVLPPGIDWLHGPLAAAVDGSDELVTEVARPDPAAMQALVARLAVLPPGHTLGALLDPGERAALAAALAANGLPPGAFDRLAPWFAAVSLELAPLARSGYALDSGVEAVLAARATARGERQDALETAAYQLGLFAALPPAVQRRFLDAVVRTLPTLDDDVAAMLAAWRRGDADALARLVNADEDDPAMVRALVTDRNRAWADWIAHRLATPGTVFIAVGAGHLAGPGSVQAQLAARGLAVTRVQ